MFRNSIVRTVFMRFYAASLKRPRLKSAQSAFDFDDARYRFSVPLAAPFVALTAAIAVIVRHKSPHTLSAHAAAIIVCVSLVAAGSRFSFFLADFIQNCPRHQRLLHELSSLSVIVKFLRRYFFGFASLHIAF